MTKVSVDKWEGFWEVHHGRLEFFKTAEQLLLIVLPTAVVTLGGDWLVSVHGLAVTPTWLIAVFTVHRARVKREHALRRIERLMKEARAGPH